MAIDFEKDDILIIARYLSEQGFYYSPQWEQAADTIERLRAEIAWHEEENHRLRAVLHKIAEWDLTGIAIAALGEKE